MKKPHVPGSCFTCAPIDELHPSLAKHLHSQLAQTARYDPDTKSYRFLKNGVNISCGGVHNTLKSIFYPHYKDNRSRRSKKVKVKGSSKAQGIRVDRELANMVEGVLPKRKMHPMTHKILSYFEAVGERLQAAQVPVCLTTNATKLTQADLITMDAQGRLILYELKTGAPIGFRVKQGTFQVHNFEDIPCTKKNIWQLQLAYTRMGLEAAGIPIYKSFVIQIFEKKEEGLKLDLQLAPTWTDRLPKNPIRKPQKQKAMLKVKKTAKKPVRTPPPSTLFFRSKH